ncbi:MAG: hypothetical protein LBV06_01885 [Propionibacteriaceae bacterium]|jgi:hypothetical protein|nr:hypothetical protein [Propionibacteriaceae bacterium]
MKKREVTALVVATTLISAILAGCAGAPEPVNPWAAEFEQAMEQAESDYTRSILADGVIDPSEIRDALSSTQACLDQAQVPATVNMDEHFHVSFRTEASTTVVQDQTMATCQSQWMDPVFALYARIQINPDNQDMNGLVAACLVRHDLAPDGFTAHDWEELWDSYTIPTDSETIIPDESGRSRSTLTTHNPEAFLPGGVSITDPRVSRCRTTPLR